jgi:hypothetical protein
MRHLPIAALAASLLALPALAEVKETVHLVVSGGPNAGSHDASTERGGCTYGLAGPGSWGNQLSAPGEKDPKKFNSLQLIVPDAKKAAGGTREFLIVVGFGPLMARSAEYTVDTRAGKASGSGTVTVEDRGTTAKVTFRVATAKGVKLEGTIDCRSVTRNGT